MVFKTSLMALALITASTVASAATFTIDAFMDDDVVYAPGQLFLPESSQTLGGMLGGSRDALVETTDTGFATVKLQVTSGLAGFSSRAGVAGTATFTWDGDDDPTTVSPLGLGGEDVTMGGLNEFFSLNILSADLPGGTYTVTAYDMLGNSASSTKVAGVVVSGSPEEFKFDFSEFAGVDLMDVGAIELRVDGVTALDTSFDFFGTDSDLPPAPPIPLPASLSFLLGGFAVLGAARTMRRKSAA